jgi:stage V sporulation protein B
MNKAGTVMRNGLIGSVIKLGIIAWLSSNAAIGMQGIAWSVTISVIVTTFLHIASLQRQIGFSIRVHDTLKILLATVATSLSITFFWRKFDHNMLTWQLIFTLSGASILYIMILWVTGVIRWRTLIRLPLLNRFVRHR